MAAPTVAFLGPVASYTHQAAKSAFSGPAELVPVATIKDVFESVRLGKSEYGVVPFENSTHGPVTFTLASLADREGVYGRVEVCGEVYLAVHHYLLGRKADGSGPQDESTAPGSAEQSSADGPRKKQKTDTHLSHIRRLYSHPQAFGQTTAYVSANLPGVELIETSSTSRAAALAAEDPTGGSAAVSSVMAAETTGLDVLAECIEDRPDNTTRFYILRGKKKSEKGAAAAAPEAAADSGSTVSSGAACTALSSQPHGSGASLVSFTVPHHSPGALADVLDCFRRAGLNLTSINSLPSLQRPFQYLFFVEFSHGDDSKDSSERVQTALAEVAQVAQTWRLLGTWTKPRLA